MIRIRASDDRGQANFGWLQSRHSFSFGSYFDANHMGFGPLRVINEDQVAPGKGFDTHGHRDMEILSYVLEGALEHKDSTGTGSVIRAGEIQRMTAGSGILHSEYNHSSDSPVHFLQIWILPDQTNLEPSYEQKKLDPSSLTNNFGLIAGPLGSATNVKIHQDASLYVNKLETGKQNAFCLKPDRCAWLQIARGAIEANGQTLEQGDGAALTDESKLTCIATQDAEILLFDLPANF